MYMTDEYKGPKIQYEQIVQNPPHDILGISKEKYLQTLDKFRTMMYFTLKPNQEILNWFEKNGSKAHFSVLTATPSSCVTFSSRWIFDNFGKWIRTFAYIPSKREGVNDLVFDSTKADWLVRNHVNIFIDDSPKNIIEVQVRSDNKINCYLVKQPWSNEGMPISDILKEIEEKLI